MRFLFAILLLFSLTACVTTPSRTTSSDQHHRFDREPRGAR
jgi:hypothetical protein